MAGNTFGKLFKITTFGESHGRGIGVIIDGCPAGIELDRAYIQSQLNRRKPGQSAIVTQRKEADEFDILSGVFEGKTTGTPITLFIANTNQKTKDYSHIQDRFRPSHADFTYSQKYINRDYRGGGRSSARETAARVAAGAIAQQILAQKGIQITAYVSQVGPLSIRSDYKSLDLSLVEKTPVRCPDLAIAKEMEAYIKAIKKEGDTTGGVVSCVIKGCPVGLGEPVFDRLHAELGKAMLSINACKGFQYGSGFEGVSMRGSEHNDPFVNDNGRIKTSSNHSGGIQGGISNGMDIYFQTAFKPVATIMRDQQSVDLKGEVVTITGRGRHDPCVVPRAVPIVEGMAALVLLDYYLLAMTDRLKV
ncbi:chorismate synthase [Aureispira anguillae]|uniref:Chorismate synthase n=1 Tax=Aureispira anguillae TaxID=2864201 RepID=A0A915YJ07_9BACT|nr:chorismate synthase [Aureispira anguillae]BDS13882.1 chorismate synthase [Aureispira anguillae]